MEDVLNAEYFLEAAKVDRKWSGFPSDEAVADTVKNIESRGIKVVVVKSGKEALEKIKELIPEGVSIMNGSSTTLMEIGFVDYLKTGKHSWKNLHTEALGEQDQQKRMELMRKAVVADYFLGSVNAIAQTGELVAADASGSRVGAYPFAAKKLILVAGANKIVADLETAMKRVREYVLPLESERVKKLMGLPGSMVGKMVIFEKEMFPERTTLILVKEKLGF